MQTIVLELKESYGKRRIYPVCDTAQLLAELLERKTFLPRDLELLKQLGFNAEVRTGGAKRLGSQAEDKTKQSPEVDSTTYLAKAEGADS